ncbi:hypothetical protein J3E69DRAFT_367448 [Trichoderma sp. SZMC 28015]
MSKKGFREKFKEFFHFPKSPGHSPNKIPLSSQNESHTSLQSGLDKPNKQQPLDGPSSSLNDLPSSSPNASQSLTVPQLLINKSSASAIASQITTAAIAPPTVEVSVPSIIIQQPVPSSLWKEAFLQANDETQRWIRNNGLDLLEQAKSEDLINLMNELLLEEKSSPSKIEIGNQRIVPREYISDIIRFLTMAGDVAINFAPPQASAPWAVAKALLKIPVKRIEQMAALAGAIQLFARIIHKGQVYEHLYNATTTDAEAVSDLRDSLRDLYIAAIELLARSDILIKGGSVKQALNAILRPEQASDLVSDLLKKEQRVSLQAQVCEDSRSEKADEKMDERMEGLLTTLNALSSPLTRIDKGVNSLLVEVEKNRLETLMDFISSEKFGTGHSNIQNLRIEGTGDWLINHEGFHDWQVIASSSTLLCLKGTIGTGKTYLTSRVIDHVKQTLETSSHDEGFAFFYCKRSVTLLLDPLIVLRSFVRQLSYKAYHYDRIQTSVIRKCELAKQEGRELSYKDCKELILISLNLYPKTTLILDALDESDTSTYNLAEIFIELMKKATKPVKVFISSRPDREYFKVFEDKHMITVNSDNQQGDIERFLHKTLYSKTFFTGRNAEIQEMIKDKFRSRNGGMFKWVQLQVQHLLSQVSDDAIWEWSRNIPPDLTTAYDRLWDNIRQQRSEHDVALAERAVKWVLCAFVPLQCDFLLEAIRYSLENNDLVQKEKHSEEEILLLCQDILTIDAEKRIWTLPHASVAEYFESRNMSLGNCDVFASIISLKFLMRSELWSSDFEWYTFEGYVSFEWPRHIQRYDKWLGSMKGADPDQTLVTTLKSFLGSVEESSDHYRKWLSRADLSYQHAEPTLEIMSLFVMSRFGFYYVLRDWWEEGKVNKEMALLKWKSDDEHLNSLVLAALGGCLPICKYLVGVIGLNNSPAEGHFQAMERAIDGGNEDIVSFLVEEAKVDVNICYSRTTAVQQVARAGSTSILQRLVDQGWVDVNREGGKHYGNALIAAATAVHVKPVEILLKAGADVNAAVECGNYGSALVAAASASRDYHYIEKIQLLLSKTADPNLPLKGGKYGSALEAVIVSAFDRYDITESAEDILSLLLLLKAGADPTIITDQGDYGSALAAAACCGFKDFLEMMVDFAGHERARECLRQSRRPKVVYSQDRWLGDRERAERWRQSRSEIIAYLINQIGVGNMGLYRIGLRDWG